MPFFFTYLLHRLLQKVHFVFVRGFLKSVNGYLFGYFVLIDGNIMHDGFSHIPYHCWQSLHYLAGTYLKNRLSLEDWIRIYYKYSSLLWLISRRYTFLSTFAFASATNFIIQTYTEKVKSFNHFADSSPIFYSIRRVYGCNAAEFPFWSWALIESFDYLFSFGGRLTVFFFPYPYFFMTSFSTCSPLSSGFYCRLEFLGSSLGGCSWESFCRKSNIFMFIYNKMEFVWWSKRDQDGRHIVHSIIISFLLCQQLI